MGDSHEIIKKKEQLLFGGCKSADKQSASGKASTAQIADLLSRCVKYNGQDISFSRSGVGDAQIEQLYNFAVALKSEMGKQKTDLVSGRGK